MKSEKDSVKKQVGQTAALKVEDKFPINSPESQGDLADQAELQIEADLQEEIEQAKRPKGSQKSAR